GLFVLLFRCLPFANFSWVSSCLGLDFLFAGFPAKVPSLFFLQDYFYIFPLFCQVLFGCFLQFFSIFNRRFYCFCTSMTSKSGVS
ncbi:MAG: hypothetical protein KH138_13515, partial [Firmicutes bacterium]|nr:hypothetical protein [Bacillota bacterium]